jgi:hypothetical protein
MSDMTPERVRELLNDEAEEAPNGMRFSERRTFGDLGRIEDVILKRLAAEREALAECKAEIAGLRGDAEKMRKARADYDGASHLEMFEEAARLYYERFHRLAPGKAESIMVDRDSMDPGNVAQFRDWHATGIAWVDAITDLTKQRERAEKAEERAEIAEGLTPEEVGAFADGLLPASGDVRADFLALAKIVFVRELEREAQERATLEQIERAERAESERDGWKRMVNDTIDRMKRRNFTVNPGTDLADNVMAALLNQHRMRCKAEDQLANMERIASGLEGQCRELLSQLSEATMVRPDIRATLETFWGSLGDKPDASSKNTPEADQVGELLCAYSDALATARGERDQWIHAATDGTCSPCSHAQRERERAETELKRMQAAARRSSFEIEQTLGRALGYPRYCDSPENFPDATDADGVCTGDHVPETLAAEAADRIRSLELELSKVSG